MTAQPNRGPTTGLTPHLNIPDKRAVEAIDFYVKAFGATPTMPPQNMFWGDRYGQLQDPFGHVWSIGSRIEEQG